MTTQLLGRPTFRDDQRFMEADTVVARVSFSGWLDGAVQMACSAPEARVLSQLLCGDDSLGSETVAELLNVVAGQVKSILGDQLSLDVPCRGDEVEPVSAWPGFVAGYVVDMTPVCGFTLMMWDAEPLTTAGR